MWLFRRESIPVFRYPRGNSPVTNTVRDSKMSLFAQGRVMLGLNLPAFVGGYYLF